MSGLDNLPDEILKALPMNFHKMLILIFFWQCYLQKTSHHIENTT